MQSDLPAPINGYVDDVSHEDIRGWAFDPAQPDVAVTLVVSADDAVLARVVANSFRADLAAAGIGDGRHAFRIECGKLGLPLGPVTISVQVEGSGVHLPRSPWRLEAPLLLTEAVRQRVAALFETPGEAGELCERAAFLAGQAEQLLQRVAERQSRRGERAAALARKWRWRAEDGPEPGPAVPRALVVDSTAPAAGRDAGSNAVTSHMLSLQRLGFEVTFVAADMTAAPSLLALGVAAVGVPWAASVEEVLRRQSGLGTWFTCIGWMWRGRICRWCGCMRRGRGWCFRWRIWRACGCCGRRRWRIGRSCGRMRRGCGRPSGRRRRRATRW